MWVSGLISPGGTAARVIQVVMEQKAVAVVTPQLLKELRDVLARPRLARWVDPADGAAFVDALEVEGEMIPDIATPESVVRDPRDDYLAAAAQAAAVEIVTGDKDLLDAPLTPAAITPRQLLERLA